MTDNNNDNQYEKVCYMCRRSESKAGPMLQMPGGINVCHDCMQKSMDQAMTFTNNMPPEVLQDMMRFGGMMGA